MTLRVSRTRHHRDTPAFRREALALGRSVRSLRTERGWTLEEAAEQFGVQPACVRRIESGRTNTSLAIIVSIAIAFDMRVSDVLADQ